MDSLVDKWQKRSSSLSKSSNTPLPNRETIHQSRRSFIKQMGATSAGLMLGCYVSVNEAFAEGQSPERSATEKGHGAQGWEANAFVRITPDNKVIVIMKHLEMGQGTHTGLATLVAEELDADWSQMVSEAAPADASKYKNFAFGAQGTGGSTAMLNAFMQMRKAGAAARSMLVAAAAKQWGVKASDITVKKGVIYGPNNVQATFGELASLASEQSVPPDDVLRLKKPEEFIYIGKAVSRIDRGKQNGTAIFTIDLTFPNMQTAVTARPPRFGATVKSVDDGAARKIKGVSDVVTLQNSVAVLADNFWSAKKGRDALNVEWDFSQATSISDTEIDETLTALSTKPGATAQSTGDAVTLIDSSSDQARIEATYDFPYLAHAAMEPLNCIAKVTADGCELWYGAQLQTLDQAVVAGALGLKPEQVQIHTQLAGGSFGRRACAASDYVLEAALIAKAKPGIPVKLQWTREDDTRAGFYRPVYRHRLRAILDEKGFPKAWQQRVMGPSIAKGTAFEAFMVKEGVDHTSVEGVSNMPYAIPNLHVDLHSTDFGVPVLWWRSVGHTHTAYTVETFIDLLAHRAKKDPLQYRRTLLAKHPRHLAVLELAAQKAGWGEGISRKRFQGLAVHASFNSYVAQVVEIEPDSSREWYRIHRVVCAVDCGLAINPDNIVAQVEGAIAYGLSAALMSELTLKDGAVEQSNFHDYSVLRMDKMPTIEVHIVPSTEAPTGIGEPATPPIAPAYANALFAATGKMHYRLPIEKHSSS